MKFDDSNNFKYLRIFQTEKHIKKVEQLIERGYTYEEAYRKLHKKRSDDISYYNECAVVCKIIDSLNIEYKNLWGRKINCVSKSNK